MAKQQEALRQKVTGHMGYYAVSFNYRSMEQFQDGTIRVWKKWLNRRGSPRTVTWEQMRAMLARAPWPKLQIKHQLFGRSPPKPNAQPEFRLM